MYKCSYCDSVFMTYNVNCPNCGGCNWLTSKESELDIEPLVPENTEQEVAPENEPVHSSKLGDLISLLFALLMLSICVWIVVTSEPLRHILDSIFGI